MGGGTHLADNFLATDAQGSTITFRSTESGGIHTPHRIIDSITDPVSITGAIELAAGSAIIGAVDFNTGLLSGNEHIGAVEIDQPLPVGANVIGETITRNTLNTTASGTIDAVNENVEIACDGAGMVGVELLGTSVQTVVYEATIDGTTWFAVNALVSTGTSISQSTTFPTRAAFLLPAAYKKVRVRTSAYTSGSIVATLTANSATNIVTLGTSGATIGALAAGSAVIGALAAGSNLIGQVNVAPRTTGGCTMYHRKATGDTNLVSIKGSAGQIYGLHVVNRAGAERFVKLYNKASAPVLLSDVPVIVIPLRAGETAVISEINGMAFSAGIAMAITGGIGDTDTTALTANDVVLNLRYT